MASQEFVQQVLQMSHPLPEDACSSINIARMHDRQVKAAEKRGPTTPTSANASPVKKKTKKKTTVVCRLSMSAARSTAR
jgi:hypothetical protein